MPHPHLLPPTTDLPLHYTVICDRESSLSPPGSTSGCSRFLFRQITFTTKLAVRVEEGHRAGEGGPAGEAHGGHGVPDTMGNAVQRPEARRHTGGLCNTRKDNHVPHQPSTSAITSFSYSAHSERMKAALQSGNGGRQREWRDDQHPEQHAAPGRHYARDRPARWKPRTHHCRHTATPDTSPTTQHQHHARKHSSPADRGVRRGWQ